MADNLVSHILAWLSRPLRRAVQDEAERALREANERFELVLAGADAAVWDWDVAGNTIAHSSRWKAMRGFAEHETPDGEQDWSKGIHPDDAPRVNASVQAHLDGRTPFFAEEYRARRKDGSWMWVADRGLAQRDATGRVVRMAGSETDITERKRAEEALDVHRQLLETVVSQMPAAVCLIRGSDLRLQLINPAYQAIAPGKKMLGKTLDELWPETGQNFAAICRRVLETGESHQVVDEPNVIRRHPDGPLEPAYFSWSLHRVQLPGGEGWGLLVVAWETTERKQVEAQAQRLARQRQLALDAAKLGWWEYNPITRIAEWDDVYRAIFGVAGYTLPNDEILQEIIHPEDRPGLSAKVEAALDPADPQPFAAEYRINRPDGEMRWVEAHGIVTFEGEGAARRACTFVGTVEDITERKAADQALAASELRFRQVVESLPQLMWTCRADGTCDYLSPQWIRYTGVPEAPQLGYGWLEQLHPDDRDRTVAAWHATAARGEEFAIEFRIRRHDGAYRWFRTLAVPLRDETGTIVKWFGTNTDIQDIKHAEQALRASEARLRLAQASAGAGMWDWDVATGKLDWSEELFHLFGLDPTAGEPSFEAWRGVLHPDDRLLAQQRIESALADHTALASEYRVVLPSGSERWISALGHATYDPGGTPLRMSGICIDITERKQAEDLARDQEKLLELVTNTVPALIAYVDREFRYRRANQTYLHWFGVAPEQMKGRHFREVIGEAAWEVARPRLEWALAGELVSYEGRMPYRSGGERWVATTLVPDRDATGKVQGVVAFVTDITELKQVEQDLRRSEERYRALFESMAEGFALHEIIVDEEGRPRDYRFLEVNPSFGRLTGLDPHAVGGRTVREVIPTVEESWIETYGRVAQAGASERFDRYIAALGRWYEVFAFSPAPGRFATAFTDITARKQAEAALRESREDLDRAQEVGQVGSWRLDVRRNVLKWSDENHRIFGVPKGTPLTYEAFLGIVHPDDREYVDAKWNAALRGEPYDIEHRIVVDEQVKWVREKAFLEFDSEGALLGGFGITQDISDRKRAEQELRESLAEKELLLREIHHRVKNNLQVVSSLVSLQADALADPALREVFGEVRDRVRSMGLVHEKLYDSGGLSQLNFADYAAGLTRSLWSAHGSAGAKVKLQLEVEPVALSVATAVPCGLILNELVSNALKHAFPSRGGAVTVGLTREPGPGRLLLRVQDNGVGLPAGFDWRRASSLGLRLVQMLAGQLQGTVETGPGPGTEFRVSFVAKEVEGVPAPSGATRLTTSEGHP